jgi:lactoylglutathione lyase
MKGVTMVLAHAALWVRDLEAMKDFYVSRFGATAGGRYENKAKGFTSYFLSFEGGARLELMRKDSMTGTADDSPPGERFGYAHLAFSCGSAAEVDRLAERFKTLGIRIVSGPRRTGDGYYEVLILDPEGNSVEITA